MFLTSAPCPVSLYCFPASTSSFFLLVPLPLLGLESLLLLALLSLLLILLVLCMIGLSMVSTSVSRTRFLSALASRLVSLVIALPFEVLALALSLLFVSNFPASFSTLALISSSWSSFSPIITLA
uniref:ABC transmembrane type-1 domain-containing protein n=1 Tax=Cacopsylla melanoneura TaxID=428564 RepID=A0A8D8XG58_9HEMI